MIFNMAGGDSTRIFRATCTTTAATAAKVATLDTSNRNFSLTTGVMVAVTFTYGNSATTPTLRVDGDSTGTAKNMAVWASNSSVMTGGGATYFYWGPYETIVFTYDGTNWIIGQGGAIYKAYSLANSKTSNTGTVTKVTAGTGLSIGTTAGGNITTSGTINHTNSVTAQTTQAVYPVKIDAQGHISAYGSAVTIPTVPTNISAFTNDVGYITDYTETDPTVPSWAKASSKPSYTASEVGAAASSHAHGNITSGGDITATAPTIASGDQIIINDNSASKITNGPTFDGSTTTKALTPKGTWETFLKSYTETDPTVPSWAKASSKPSYTASEVGAVPTSRTVNGKALSSDITLSASDVSALPSSTSILSTTPTLSSTGLSVTSSRCQITSGGIYSFGNWRFVQLQLTIKASLSANNTWGLLSGMPLPVTGHVCALAASAQQNYGNVSANVSAAGSLVVQTAGKALASGDVLMVTGWYIVAS